MATTTFAAGTVIASTWLNDVDALVYDAVVSVPWTTVTWSGSNVTHSGNHTWSGLIGIGAVSGAAKLEVSTGNGSYNAINARFNSVNAPIGFGVANSNGFAYLGYNTKQITTTDNQSYDTTAAATRLRMDNGNFIFSRAASGTAGNTITWTDFFKTDSSENVLVTGAGGLGYGTGSGGTVTQATSKSTDVTLNKTNGQIVMNNAALAAGSTAQFLCNNSTVIEKDVVIITQNEAISALNYNIWAAVGAGYIRFHVKNIGVGSLSDALTINFAVIKATTS